MWSIHIWLKLKYYLTIGRESTLYNARKPINILRLVSNSKYCWNIKLSDEVKSMNKIRNEEILHKIQSKIVEESKIITSMLLWISFLFIFVYTRWVYCFNLAFPSFILHKQEINAYRNMWIISYLLSRGHLLLAHDVLRYTTQ